MLQFRSIYGKGNQFYSCWGEDVEIIVVNDGSKDGTQEIAERYQEKYPTIVKAVEKPNGGHGDAVNCGLEHATGKYFKVVDSDDWVDEEALLKVLDTIKGFVKDESEVDMVIANYVYEKVGMTHKKVIRYDNVLPENQILNGRISDISVWISIS